MEHLRHEVPTHIETPDTMAGIAMEKWFYLFYGLVSVFMLFLIVNNIFDVILTTSLVICGVAMLPILVIFFLPLGDDRIEQRLLYRMRFFIVPKICVWRTDDWRWQQLLVEKTGRKPSSDTTKSTEDADSKFWVTEEI